MNVKKKKEKGKKEDQGKGIVMISVKVAFQSLDILAL